MSVTYGVMFDAAFQIIVTATFGGINPQPYIGLFCNDLVPDPADNPPLGYNELFNSGYSRITISNAQLQTTEVDGITCIEILGVQWSLDSPEIGFETIYGWFMSVDNIIATTFALWGGRFDAPITIPPAGLLLQITQIALPLVNCTSPPPPPPPSGRKWETDNDKWEAANYTWEGA